MKLKAKIRGAKEAREILGAEETREAREDQVRHLPNPAVSKFVSLQVRNRPNRAKKVSPTSIEQEPKKLKAKMLKKQARG